MQLTLTIMGNRVSPQRENGGGKRSCGPYSHCAKNAWEHYYLFGEACGFGRGAAAIYERQEQQYEHEPKVKENTVVVGSAFLKLRLPRSAPLQ